MITYDLHLTPIASKIKHNLSPNLNMTIKLSGILNSNKLTTHGPHLSKANTNTNLQKCPLLLLLSLDTRITLVRKTLINLKTESLTFNSLFLFLARWNLLQNSLWSRWGIEIRRKELPNLRPELEKNRNNEEESWILSKGSRMRWRKSKSKLKRELRLRR